MFQITVRIIQHYVNQTILHKRLNVLWDSKPNEFLNKQISLDQQTQHSQGLLYKHFDKYFTFVSNYLLNLVLNKDVSGNHPWDFECLCLFGHYICFAVFVLSLLLMFSGNLLFEEYFIFNRPGVARAVLKTQFSFINSFIYLPFSSKSSLKLHSHVTCIFDRTFTSQMCHMSHVGCLISCAMCHIPHITCHISQFYFPVVELVGGGSVSYQ